MSDFADIYYDLVARVGEDKLNRLILLERAANQEHWAKKINQAVRMSMLEKDTTKIMDAVQAVTMEMVKQAKEYDHPHRQERS